MKKTIGGIACFLKHLKSGQGLSLFNKNGMVQQERDDVKREYIE